MASFDLHLHTEWSYDASAPVRDYFRIAKEKKCRAIAITDHHLMDAYEEVLESAAEFPEVGYLSGSEISVNCEFGPIDLVCLNLPRRPTPETEELFDIYHKWQVASGTATSKNLCSLGFDFDDDARLALLRSYRPAKTIAKQGNTHIKYPLMIDHFVKCGFCTDEADYLELRKKFTFRAPYPNFDQVIPLIKKAGGVVIIAHPFRYFLGNNIERMDRLREMFQLDGIECSHPDVPEELTGFYREYCLKYNLLSSSGSDLHSPVAEKFAAQNAPDRWLDEILERVAIYHGA